MVAQDSQDSPLLPIVLASAEDLATLSIAAALEGVEHADTCALEQAFERAATEAESHNDMAAKRGYMLLSALCSIHMQIENPGDIWVPKWQDSSHRTHIPSDFRGEQTTILNNIVKNIEHPALRARVADIVWYNDRTKCNAAVLAIEAYCELVRRCLDSDFACQFDDVPNSIFDLVDWIHRALQLAVLSRKRGEMPNVLREVFDLIYNRAVETGHYAAFIRLAELGTRHGLIVWSKVAPDAEKIASQRVGGDYPMPLHDTWDLAAHGYTKLGDNDAKRRCQSCSVDEILRMRGQVDSASAKVHWTRQAIGKLRQAGGFKSRINELRAELRELQDASLDEFGHFSIPIDLTQERQETVELFERLSLPDILLQFALRPCPPKIDELRRQALENREHSVLGSLMGASYADHEGKAVAETPAMPLDGEPSADWFKGQSLRFLDLWYHQVVVGFIEPARFTTMLRFPLEDRYFEPIVRMSPFVPPGHNHLFALGFTRFWQGDYASAAHLLIPQLENSLRHVLSIANHDSSKIKSDLLQEDCSLSELLKNFHAGLVKIFGEDLINELDLLFNHRAGPALRHEMAHGKVSTDTCYHPSTIYACWLIYHLTCIPLMKQWKDIVAPAIEQATF
ncbi:hypothetical protein dsx2_0309 [Desulfovibrio sp. X2]|uniref:DUF4209 domain-containing protein n=1 Tax=Desulfovibrio sp. X2 TaxID=941449 RepID=UPI000358EC14|nr:DUF4209 domain-containing protein [Desulfovibrio sp. X2]EPR41222.1 hypothetical protein dsx2_0309 [Desulfovibrio sp. X2]